MSNNSIFDVIVLLITFIIILAACIWTTRLVAGRQMLKNKNKNIMPIETYQIAPNRYLQIVQIGERYIVISVCKDSVQFITELTKEELHLQEGTAYPNKTFKEILSEWKCKVEKG